jgi:membrane protein YqaA with SNARE-associated domain
MSAEGLIGSIGLPAATFVIALVGAVFPIISIEVFLIGVAVFVGPAEVLPIVVLAAIGQVLGKVPIYGAARGLTGLTARSPKQARRIERVRTWFARYHPTKVLAASALVGIPPFSLAATAAGILGIQLRTFCVVVGVGRAARFAAIFALARFW